jgi:leucyl-tRNA---protein transferase
MQLFGVPFDDGARHRMTLQRVPNRVLTFYRSGPMPCPYLPGRIEQQLFTELSGNGVQEVFEQLSLGGFRRSHHIAYRPACRGCSACVPVRIAVDGFEMGKSWQRVMRANADLRVESAGKRISDEQFLLFQRYVRSRHGDGDMARMNRRDYASMVVSSPVQTELAEFRDRDGRLMAACLMDWLGDGLSAVYSFYEPDAPKRSLGTQVVLWMVAEARRLGLPYVYLGFWIEHSPKMAYKGRFRPLEGFSADGWKRIR